MTQLQMLHSFITTALYQLDLFTVGEGARGYACQEARVTAGHTGSWLPHWISGYSLSSSAIAAVTKYYRLVSYKQQKCVFHSSGGWKVQDQGARTLGVWRGTSAASQMPIVSLRPHQAERARKLLALFCKSHHGLITAQRPHLQILSHQELGYDI